MEKTPILKLNDNGSLNLALSPDVADKLGWGQGDLIYISIVEDSLFIVKLSKKVARCVDNFEDLALIEL